MLVFSKSSLNRSVPLDAGGGGGGGLVTTSDACPLTPPLVATMFADPAATPVTAPVDETVAMAVLLDDQAIARPVSALPDMSRSVAVADVVVPETIELAPSATLTDATGAGGTTTEIDA
jgi:hypothetical protein